MSRIGKNPVPVPAGVTIEVSGQNVKANGKLGQLALVVHDEVSVTLEEGVNGGKQVRLTKHLLQQARFERLAIGAGAQGFYGFS